MKTLLAIALALTLATAAEAGAKKAPKITKCTSVTTTWSGTVHTTCTVKR
jgi:hypothetical protein